MSAPDADQDLMRRIQEGDAAAFEVLVHAYQGLVLSLVRRYLGSRYAGVEDVAQDVFVRIYRARHGWQPRAQVKTWVYSIAVNACLNEIRKLRSQKHRLVGSFTAVFGGEGDEAEQAARGARVEDPRTGLEPAGGAGRAAGGRGAAGADGADDVGARVRAAVDALPEQQRLATVLARFHGCSHEEVAEVMGTTVPAVKSLLMRARDRLRRVLADLAAPGVVPAGEDA